MKIIPPKEMANQIVKLFKKQRPDAQYVKKVFQYVRESLDLKGGTVQTKKLPELMTEDELKRFYEAVWKGFNRSHMVMLKLLLFTGIRNDELVNLTLQDVDLDQMRLRINQGKGGKDRYVLFPRNFRGELAQYISGQQEKGAVYLFETNRLNKYTTRWVREIAKKYARKAGINKRIYPHLFRHQFLTYLTSKGIVDAKIQLISGHKSRDSLSRYQDLSLADVDQEYWDVMEDFPIQ
ncbi:MAG: tyrosine-type recombinase/integrase [Desulfobacterales bacterium]|nr:tyrosine-type recombinase/integrase [Desulfobacterales bacterium]